MLCIHKEYGTTAEARLPLRLAPLFFAGTKISTSRISPGDQVALGTSTVMDECVLDEGMESCGTTSGEVHQMTPTTVTLAMDRALSPQEVDALMGRTLQLLQVPSSVTFERSVAASACPALPSRSLWVG